MSNSKSLKELPIFSSLTDDEIKSLSDISGTQTISADELVFSEGDQGDILYVIITGSVRIYTKITENVDKTLVILRSGGLFGEMAVISEDYRTATAIALEETTLLTISQKEFKNLLENNPAAGKKLLEFIVKVLADRLKNTTDLYRQAVDWGISVSGILELNYNQLISQKQKVTIDLNSGKNVSGTLLKVEKHASGLDLLLKTDSEKFVIIPYAAVSSIYVGASTVKQQE
jgi:CRP-like cAMP-binding protein